MPGNSEYPPQFADSCVAGIVGQINDFAGPYDSVSNDLIAAKPAAATQGLTAGVALGGAVPVVLTAPVVEQLPGIREALIAASIIRLAHQLPPTNPLRDEIRAVALKLYAHGGTKIAEYGGGGTTPPPPSSPPPGKKPKK